MLSLKIIKDTIAYILAVIIWIPTRALSIVIQLFNIFCVKVIMHRWRLIGLLYLVSAIAIPQYQGANLFFAEGHIFNILRLIYYYQLVFRDNPKEIITTILVLLILGYIISKLIVMFFGMVVLDITTFIHEKLIYVSKYLTRRRLVILEKDIRAKRDGGFYNIQTFKEKYMY